MWTEDLCKEDSDGDGKTNGEELGDANCTWTEGINSLHTYSHRNHFSANEVIMDFICGCISHVN